MRAIGILLTAALAASAGAAEITIRAAAAPRDAIVRLGDVADIAGPAAERARLARLPLMPTPAPGEVQHVRARVLRDLLRAQGEPLERHAFRGAASVAVGAAARPAVDAAARPRRDPIGYRLNRDSTERRTVHLITSRDRVAAKRRVREAVDAWIARRHGDAAPLSVSDIQLTDDQARVVLGMGEAAVVAQPGEPTPAEGTALFRIAAADAPHDAVEVELGLVELPLAVVATSPLRRGELITAARIALRPLPLDVARTAQGRKALPDLESAIGKLAKRSIRVDEPLTDTNCESPILVRRGEDVSVVSGGGGVTVRLLAVARGDGRLGDLVSVESYDRERFAARVVGRGRLAIVGVTAGDARLASAAAAGAAR